jgi:spermidine synthase
MPTGNAIPDHRQRRVLCFAVSSLGASAIVTQLTLMRELHGAFSGNELVFGIVLGNWMLLTGLGAYLGKTVSRLARPVVVLVAAQVAVALLPIADVFLLRTVRDVVFVRGAEVGVTETVVSCLVLLAPYCLVIGYLLTLATGILSPAGKPDGIGRVYFLDNLGGIGGGLAFGFLLVPWLNHFQILYLLAMLNLAAAGLTAWTFRRRVLLGLTAATAVGLAGAMLAWDLDRVSARIQFPGQRIIFRGNSPYGSLMVTESSGQCNFIENGLLLFATHNIEDVEQAVHFAMAQRPDARRVLLLGGGVAGAAREILKYRGATVDYVELDPLILEVGRKYLPASLADRRIRVINADGRLFLRQRQGGAGILPGLPGHRLEACATEQTAYDVAIVNVPDPSTSQINRFYTQEFLHDLRGRMKGEGVVSLAIGCYEDHVSDELARLIAVTHKTLRQEFRNVLMIPAGRIVLLASDGPLTTRIADRLEAHGIRTQLLHRRFLEDLLAPLRMADLRRAVSESAPVNRDFSPILYYYHLRYWMSQFRVGFGLLEAALVVLTLVCLFRARPISLAVFTTGFAASALEVVLLVGFQILYGFVYHQVSLIVTMFMAGLGIGSLVMNRHLKRRTRKDLVWLGLGVAAYATGVPSVLVGLSRLEPEAAVAAAPIVVPLLALLLAVLVGLTFPLAGKADFQTVTSTTARLYTADYLGAALGALLVSTLLIPVLGVAAVCYLTAGLCLASSGVLFWTS